MKRLTLTGLLVFALLTWATPGFATSRSTQAVTLRKLAIQEQNSSLKYVHSTWFNANYRYAIVPIASIIEATGTADATGTIEVLNPAHGFSVASSDQRVASNSLSLTTVTRPSVGTTRRQASACYATALALGNNTFDPKRVGISRRDAVRRTVAWTNALALSHSRHEWGDSWQSALWTYYLGAGSKRIWSALPTCTQELVTAAVVDEANRLSKIPPPYYRNAKGVVVRKGYSPAADNAWNATLLLLASRMYASGDATKAAKWEAQGRLYALTAYATPSQVGKDSRIKGSNLNADGTVMNHRRIHPDYMATSGEMEVKNFLTAGWSSTREAPECYNGLTTAWSGLTKTKFRAGNTFKRPGGTIYRCGSHGTATVNIYYPQGTDWASTRRHNFALMDVAMFVAGHGYAYGWAKSHIGYILRQQARHKDGRVFSAGETHFTEEEQFAAACASEMVESLRTVH